MSLLRIAFSLVLSLLSVSVYAISYPTTTPTGETAGGTYRTYFDNMFSSEVDCYGSGRVVGGFNSVGVPFCVIPAPIGLNILGSQTGDTLRFDGTDWVHSNLLYNNGTQIGIGMQTPGYILDVLGTANFTALRFPTGAGSGKVLTSDASGNMSWMASFSGTVDASNIVGGTQDYITKFGAGGNGLFISQLFDNGTRVGIGTATPAVGYKVDINGGDLLINTLTLGRGGGNILSNSVFGWSALALNAIGTMNTALGYGALSSLASGDSNVALGNLAGSTLTSGSTNIFIGNNIQPSSTTISNELNIGNWIYGTNGNIGIGTATPGAKLEIAGQIKITGGGAGSGKVLVSDATGLASWQASVPASSVDATNITGGVPNYITKFGSGGTGIFPSLFYESAGLVGLGNTNPSATLDINGNIRIRNGAGAGLVLVSDATGLATWSMASATTVAATGVLYGTEGYIPKFGTGGDGLYPSLLFQSGSRMGINTATPGYTLDVAGTGNLTGLRFPTNPLLGGILTSDTTGNASWSLNYIGTTTASGITGGASGYLSVFGAGGNGLYSSRLFQSGAYMGIGTATPGYTLDVSGTGNFIGLRLPTGAGLGKVLTSDASGNVIWSSSLSGSTATGITGGASGYLSVFGTGGNGLYPSLLFQSGSRMGINTATPGYTLDVAGTGNLTGLRFPTNPLLGGILTSDTTGNASWSLNYIGTTTASGITGGASGYLSVFGAGGNGLYSSLLFQSGAYMGIGTATPGAKLEIAGQIKITGGTPGVNKVLTSDAAGLASWTNALTSLSGSFWSLSGNAIGASDFFGTTNAQDLRLYTNNTQKMVITSVGRVGIGVANPVTANLELSGSALISGDLTVQGKVITDTIVNRTVTNVTVSGSLFPDNSVPLAYRDIGANTQRWNNLYLSGQVNIAGGSPGVGKILTSDATGLASWSLSYIGTTTASGITGGASGYLSVFGVGGNGLYSSRLFQSGAFMGIGTVTPGYTLDVAGTGNFTGLRLPTGAGLGRVLTSDASGNVTWATSISGSTATGITGGTQNYLPKFGTGGNGLYISQIFDNGNQVGVGTGANLLTKFTIDSGINNDSGLRLARINPNSPLTSNAVVALGIDGSGKVLPISPISNIAVYTGVLRTTTLTPNPDLNTFNVTYNFNQYFAIPGKQSFVVSKGDGASYNGPYFKENGVSALCSITGTYGSPGAYDCENPDPVTGISASPNNSFTMSAKGDTFGYQLALGARGDAPLFARSGRFNGSQTGGLYTNDSPYQTPAPWQRVLSVPANHPEYLYINTGLNSQLQAISGGGNVAIGTTTPASKFEVWTGATTASLLHFRGANNTALGLGAVRTALSGNANTGIGAESLYTLSSGYSNTAVGYKTMRSTAAGFNNTAIGQESLYTNNGGSWGAAFGYQALYSNSSGTGNIAMGGQSLYNVSTGNQNIAIGFQAIRAVAGSSISNNIGIGSQALYSATTSNLTAIGFGALYANTSGTQNTAIGYQSLDAVTTIGNNTAIGYASLGSTTGGSNTAIGNNAGSSLTTGSGNIIIGSNAQAVSNTTNNQLNIGDWIYGNGGNIGIGATVPTSKLEVNGTFKMGTGGTQVSNMGACTTASTTISTAATTMTCTGVPASTSVALYCNGGAAFTTAGTTALYCRPNGTASSITCNTTVANAVAMIYSCMWMQK